MWFRIAIILALCVTTGSATAVDAVTTRVKSLIQEQVDSFDPTNELRVQCKRFSKLMYPEFRDSGKSPKTQLDEILNNNKVTHARFPLVCGGYHALKALEFSSPYGYHALSAFAIYDLLNSGQQAELSPTAFLKIALAQNQDDLDEAMIDMQLLRNSGTDLGDKAYTLAASLFTDKRAYVARNITALLNYPTNIFLDINFDHSIKFHIKGKPYTHGDILNAYHKKIANVSKQKIPNLISVGTYTIILDDEGFIHYFAILADQGTFESYVFNQADIKAANGSSNFESELNAIPGLQHVIDNHPWAYRGQFLIDLMKTTTPSTPRFYME
jgi:hypothetical protein